MIPARARAWLYDTMGAGLEREFGWRRAKLLAAARGRVLEVGAGTGANLPHYPDAVDELVLAEPDSGMARRLERKLSQSGRRATIVRASAESLPFADGSFDTAVVTLVLCSVHDAGRSLAEIRRVLSAEGQLLFAEHVRSDDPRIAHWQDRLNGPWRVVAGGCNCNRRTLAAIEATPFHVVELDRGEVPKAPPIVRPLVAGRAVPG